MKVHPCPEIGGFLCKNLKLTRVSYIRDMQCAALRKRIVLYIISIKS